MLSRFRFRPGRSRCPGCGSRVRRLRSVVQTPEGEQIECPASWHLNDPVSSTSPSQRHSNPEERHG